MEPAKFIFVPLKDKKTMLDDQKNVKRMAQWSLKGNLKLKFFNFNQQFHPYQKQDFVEAFFRDPAVYSILEVYNSGWSPIGVPAKKVEYELISTTQTSMSFFDRLLIPQNGITRSNGDIKQCMEDRWEDFYIDDNLLKMFFIEDSEVYNLYSTSERNEFIFNLFKHLYVGGEWCQRDFKIEPYLQITKDFYKELMSVERIESSTDIRIRSAVFKVIAYQDDGKPLCPGKPHNIQNFVYLIVDPFKRQLAVLMNHYGGHFE